MFVCKDKPMLSLYLPREDAHHHRHHFEQATSSGSSNPEQTLMFAYRIQFWDIF